MFVLAGSGAAIGFNNIWQFPHLAASHGGGAFIIVYLFCIVLIGLPLLIAELMLGRIGRASPAGSLRRLSEQMRADPNWALLGGLSILAGLLILSYLSVIAGWTVAYALRSAFGTFAGLTADGVDSLFSQLVQDPEKQLFWHTLFLTVTMLISARGVRAGLETVFRYALPLLFLSLLLLFFYAATTDAFGRALGHLFTPDFTRLTAHGLLAASGHAFFSLGLGVGVMFMYGAYVENDTSLPRMSLLIAGIDTLVGLVAGVVIFSVLFAGGVEPASGPGLVFQALPLAFDHIPFGRFFATVFFAVLAIVGWLSALALAEPVVVWLGERFGLSRARAALLCGLAAWLAGLVTIFSFNFWAFSFKFLGVVRNLGMFDVLQILTAQVLLPLVGILIALFAGWVMRTDITRAALALRSPCAYDAWLWLTRLAVPLVLLLVAFSLAQLFA
jgi:NSS family neurotransmitter:Na+ symporter